MVVTPTLAVHLRRGLLVELGFASDRLSQLALCGEIADQGAYESALWTIDAARRVLAKIGLSAPASSAGVQLSGEDCPFVVYKALKAQFDAAVERAQDEAVERRVVRATVDNELAAVVSALRVRISTSASAKREAQMCGSVDGERIIAARIGRNRP